MKQIDLANLGMFSIVSKFMAKNKTIWQLNQLIVSCVDELNANMKIIRDAMQGLSIKPSQITKDKKIIRKALNNLAFIIKEALRIYYSMNNMTEDMQMFTFAITKFTKMTDGNFYMEAMHISERAEALSAQLEPIGITPAKLAKLKADLEKFYNMSPERELSIKTRAKLVKLIPATVKSTKDMFKNKLDSVIAMYDDDANRMFVLSYKSSRHINAKPGRHKYYSVLVKGTVKDAETNQVLSDVAIEAGVKKKKVISGEDGFFKVRIYTKDADTITFTKEGYETLTVNIPKKQVKHEVVVNGGMKKNLVIL